MFTRATLARGRHPAWGGTALLVAWALTSASCGGGDGAATPVTPPAPRPARQLTGIEVFAEQTLIRVGQAIGPLIVYGQYDDGTTGTVDVTWTSSDPAVAEVAEDGTVTGIGTGKTTITASFEEFTETLELEVDEPNVRTTRDQPDDFAGPQIHVVYALPSNAEDLNLDRYGDIARSFERIQEWVTDAIGYSFRMDTHAGELDVSFVRLKSTNQELRSSGLHPLDAIYDAIAAQVGVETHKKYGVYYFGDLGLGGGLTDFARGLAVVSVDTVSGRQTYLPGQHPAEFGYFEVVMTHELLHTFGAVPTCAPNEGRGFHVTDDPADLMYAGFDREPGTIVIDSGRDDYFDHGREDCLDIAHSPFWERVGAGRAGSGAKAGFHFEVGPGDWPIRCGVH